MELNNAQKKNTKLRVGISGASGFGKTYSSLLLAYGIASDWRKIALIDTESGSANLYSDLGEYKVLSLQPPYSPERYIEAITLCEQESVEVLIIDSISHEWVGSGGCLELHQQMGGKFQDWGTITPRHQKFIDKILNSRFHVITTSRRKVDYSLESTQNGRTRVVKHGTKEVTRDGFEYELTVNFEIIDDQHHARASKDRTGLFPHHLEFIIGPQTGKQMLSWANDGDDLMAVRKTIQNSNSLEDLKQLYQKYSHRKEALREDFARRRRELEILK